MSHWAPGEVGAKAVYHSILDELEASAKNAARRNKPTMWAYFLGVSATLVDWFDARCDEELVAEWGGNDLYAAAAVDLDQAARTACPNLLPDAAARLWAASVYARRILAAVEITVPRPSLDWLRERAA